jgi:large subunit ribosomal protein L32e
MLTDTARDVDLLLMHNQSFAAEYVLSYYPTHTMDANSNTRISHAVSARKRVEIIAKAKQLGVKVTNSQARVKTES